MEPPLKLDLKKDRGLTVEWADGSTSYYTIEYLRSMSPSAEQRELRKQMQHNPLTVLKPRPTSPGSAGAAAALTALTAEFVGRYALRIRFSDGHDTGLYTWEYLRSIDPALQNPGPGPAGLSTSSAPGSSPSGSSTTGPSTATQPGLQGPHT